MCSLEKSKTKTEKIINYLPHNVKVGRILSEIIRTNCANSDNFFPWFYWIWLCESRRIRGIQVIALFPGYIDPFTIKIYN